MKITLEKPVTITIPEKTLVTSPSKDIAITSFEVTVTDNMTDKVTCRIIGIDKTFILWEGDSYTEVGNWTNSDVEKRIVELIS